MKRQVHCLFMSLVLLGLGVCEVEASRAVGAATAGNAEAVGKANDGHNSKAKAESEEGNSDHEDFHHGNADSDSAADWGN